MRILLVADIHYALKQYDWLAAEAASFDLVVIAGDLLEISSAVPLTAQVVVVKSYLDALAGSVPVVVCSGNHDLTGELPGGERVADWLSELDLAGMARDGEALPIGDTLVSAFPWWDGEATRDRIAEQLARDSTIPHESWIWVYHAPPAGSATAWGGTRAYGDTALSDWIETYRPALVLSGHVHQAPFVPNGSWVDRMGETWVFNMGQQIGPAPAHIVLDTDAGEAFWFSLEGNERIDLGDVNAAPETIRTLPDWLRVEGPVPS